jgi:hypothetical protein
MKTHIRFWLLSVATPFKLIQSPSYFVYLQYPRVLSILRVWSDSDNFEMKKSGFWSGGQAFPHTVKESTNDQNPDLRASELSIPFKLIRSPSYLVCMLYSRVLSISNVWSAPDNSALTKSCFFGVGQAFPHSMKEQLKWPKSRSESILFDFKAEFGYHTQLKLSWRCEKWILRKILHRYSESKIFSTCFFDRIKINIFWMKNIFLKMRGKSL